MHPAFSVIFLTTLIGAGQGLFLAMYATEYMSDFVAVKTGPAREFYLVGSLLSLGLLVAGLAASFFHLGHPERAWRSAAQWRTSWLSREVLVLPVVMLLVFAYGLSHYHEIKISPWINLSLVIGGMGMIAAIGLFVCTGMIYACIRFLQEWATPLTVINFTLLGTLSGVAILTSYASYISPDWVPFYHSVEMLLLFIAFAFRLASLIRNAKLRPKSNLQTAIGIKHSHIRQIAQGSMGGSFNTREYMHGAPAWILSKLAWIFIILVFVAPAILYGANFSMQSASLYHAAAALMFIGLVIERWFFFAQANHPQNLYYQQIA